MNFNRISALGIGIMLVSGLAHADLYSNAQRITNHLLQHPNRVCQAYGQQSQVLLNQIPQLPEFAQQGRLNSIVQILQRADQYGCLN